MHLSWPERQEPRPLAADKYSVVMRKIIATTMITMIMTRMTDGNQMVMTIVKITETGTKTPRCGQVFSGDEEDDCNDDDYNDYDYDDGL